MVRRSVVIMIVALSLVACGGASAPTVQPTSGASAPAVAPKTAAQHLLDGPVTALEAAITSGDATVAKTAFEAFHEQWEVVEDGIKDASPTAYDAIEGAMEPLKDELTRAAQPDLAKAATAATALRQAITTFATSQP